MKNDAKKLPSLEDSLKEITQLIDNMEHKEQTLEQSLSNFEHGVSLVKHCQKILDEAEQKVQILIQNNNNQEELTPHGADKNEGLDANEKSGV